MKDLLHDTIVREQGVDYNSSLRGHIEFLPERQNISSLKFCLSGSFKEDVFLFRRMNSAVMKIRLFKPFLE